MNLRCARVSDAETLAELNQQLIRDERHRNQMSFAALQSRMEKWLAGDYEAYLFEYDNEVIGYALFSQEPDHTYVRQFFIRSEYRRRGHGRSAFKWLARNVWSAKGRVRLDVLVDNQVGIAFWRSLGFTDYCVTMERAGS